MPKPTLPNDLMAVLTGLKSTEEMTRLLEDLLTFPEMEALEERWSIVKLLAAGRSQRAIRDEIGVSVTTVSRGNRQLKYGSGGFAVAFDLLPALGFADPREHTEGTQ